MINAAAGLRHSGRRTPVSGLLRDRLHWLRVPERGRYKLRHLVFKAVHGTATDYLRELCRSNAEDTDRVRLRSAAHGDLASCTFQDQLTLVIVRLPSLVQWYGTNGASRIFSEGEQIRGLGPGMEPRWRSGTKPAEAHDRLWKKCINNSSTERFAITTNAQKHFSTFPEGGGGQVPPLAHACGRTCPYKLLARIRSSDFLQKFKTPLKTYFFHDLICLVAGVQLQFVFSDEVARNITWCYGALWINV